MNKIILELYHIGTSTVYLAEIVPGTCIGAGGDMNAFYKAGNRRGWSEKPGPFYIRGFKFIRLVPHEESNNRS